MQARVGRTGDSLNDFWLLETTAAVCVFLSRAVKVKEFFKERMVVEGPRSIEVACIVTI
jgi:hypothetical protein